MLIRSSEVWIWAPNVDCTRCRTLAVALKLSAVRSFASANSIADAFSPIIMAGALVLPEVRVGMIDASATATVDAVYPESRVDYGLVRTHLAGTDGVVSRFRRFFTQSIFIVSLYLVARHISSPRKSASPHS